MRQIALIALLLGSATSYGQPAATGTRCSTVSSLQRTPDRVPSVANTGNSATADVWARISNAVVAGTDSDRDNIPASQGTAGR